MLDFEKLKKDAHNLTSRGDLITLENLIKIDSEWQKFKPYKISKLLAFVNPIGSKKKYCKIKMSDAERIKLKTLAREKKEEIEREEEDRRIK